MKSPNSAALASVLALTALSASQSARSIELSNDNWTLTVSGNVNVHYAFSNCQSLSSAQSIVTIGGACIGSATGSNVSNIGNGLLPAAFTFGIATTQGGYDIAAHLGLYPGIATNDGGSPNLQQGAPAGTNVALGTTGLDVRQVYMTFGNKQIGTFTLGRNFGLFGFDAIINDMTLPGVGVAGGLSSAGPANTSLGSIGFGYIYVDTLAQMNYTTPDFSGLTLTVGIFDPLNSLTEAGTAAPKSTPGFHGKVAYATTFSGSNKLSLSSAFISQKHRYTTALGAGEGFSSFGIDFTAKADIGALSLLGSYYHGKGMGTTGLFFLADDGLGNSRKSDGYLLQATYTAGRTKFGVNYGVSKLDFANAADSLAVSNLLDENKKVTAGVYFSLTKALTLLAEVSDVKTDAHNGFDNKSTNANIGAFLAF